MKIHPTPHPTPILQRSQDDVINPAGVNARAG